VKKIKRDVRLSLFFLLVDLLLYFDLYPFSEDVFVC